jgi:hypothetical protein
MPAWDVITVLRSMRDNASEGLGCMPSNDVPADGCLLLQQVTQAFLGITASASLPAGEYWPLSLTGQRQTQGSGVGPQDLSLESRQHEPCVLFLDARRSAQQEEATSL